MATTDKEARRRRGLFYLISAGVVSLAVVAGLIALRPLGGPLGWGIRAAGMLGYWAIFLTVISSAYMRELFRLLGRPFIKAHHILAVSGLILVTLHPIGVGIRSSSLASFVPVFSSLDAFLRLGGRPAWYLIGLASLAALQRTRFRKRWRIVHFFNYVAFILATIHAVMIGTDFISPAMKAVAIALALLVALVFVRKRIQRWRLTRRR